MPIESHYDTERKIIYRILTGKITSDQIADSLEDSLNDPGYIHGAPVIWDMRQADMSGLFTRDFMQAGGHIKRLTKRRGTGYKMAIVIKEDIQFGLTRMFISLAATLPIKFKIFRSMREAEDWIQK